MGKKFKIIILIIIAFAFIKFINSFVVIAVKQTDISIEEWAEDIKYLKNKIAQKHKNPYSNIRKDELDSMFNDLLKDISSINGDEVQVRAMEIVAAIGDSHTRIMNFITKNDYCYPIELYWFDDGYYIVDTVKQYQHLIGSKLIKINDIPIDSIESKIKTLIPHENKYWLASKTPDLIRDPRVLRYFSIIDNDEAEFTFVNREAYNFKIHISPYKINDLKFIKKSNGKLAFTNKSDPNWFKYIQDKNTVYFSFNNCGINDSVVNDVFKEIENKNAEKLIIDLRNNSGGAYTPNNPLIKSIKSNGEINKKEKLYVVIGRNTFSSGLLYAIDLKQNTNTMMIGEPTGGKPNHYGEVRNFKLPNSKLVITYSTKYFDSYPENTDALYPDIAVPLLIDDYIDGIDSVLSEIWTNSLQ